MKVPVWLTFRRIVGRGFLRRLGARARDNEPTVAGLVRWYFAHPWERTVSPLSELTVEEYLRRLLEAGLETARLEAERTFPGHPLLAAADPAG